MHFGYISTMISSILHMSKMDCALSINDPYTWLLYGYATYTRNLLCRTVYNM